MFKKVLIVLVVAVAGFLVFASTRPDSYRVERSTTIVAPASVVFAQLEDFKLWPAWSPWEKKDPQMKKTFDGPAKSIGSSYAWEGNKDVGKGRMSIVASEPPTHIGFKLEFMEPFAAVASTGFTLTPETGKTTVSWAMDGTNNFVGKIFSVFMDMDKVVGGDFESGLASLKAVSEEEAAKRATAEAQAAAAAAAQAAKVAADAAQAAKVAAETAALSKEKPKGKH